MTHPDYHIEPNIIKMFKLSTNGKPLTLYRFYKRMNNALYDDDRAEETLMMCVEDAFIAVFSNMMIPDPAPPSQPLHDGLAEFSGTLPSHADAIFILAIADRLPSLENYDIDGPRIAMSLLGDISAYLDSGGIYRFDGGCTTRKNGIWHGRILLPKTRFGPL